MSGYDVDKDYALIIAVLDGRLRADDFFTSIKSRDDSGELHVKEAATFTREENGKIRLNNKGYVGGWKGGGIGLAVGILLGGPIGLAAVGGIVGYMRSKERRELRDSLNAQLGPEQSAIALTLDNPIDWEVLREVGNAFGAKLLHAEIGGEPLAKVAELAEDENVQQAVEEEFDEVVAE